MDLLHGQLNSKFLLSARINKQLSEGVNLLLTVTALGLASTVNYRLYNHFNDPFKLHATRRSLFLLLYGLFSLDEVLGFLKHPLLPSDRSLHNFYDELLLFTSVASLVYLCITAHHLKRCLTMPFRPASFADALLQGFSAGVAYCFVYHLTLFLGFRFAFNVKQISPLKRVEVFSVAAVNDRTKLNLEHHWNQTDHHGKEDNHKNDHQVFWEVSQRFLKESTNLMSFTMLIYHSMMALFILSNLLQILYIKWRRSSAASGGGGGSFSAVNLVIVYFLFFTYLVPSLVVIVLLAVHWDCAMSKEANHEEDESVDVLEFSFEFLRGFALVLEQLYLFWSRKKTVAAKTIATFVVEM